MILNLITVCLFLLDLLVLTYVIELRATAKQLKADTTDGR